MRKIDQDFKGQNFNLLYFPWFLCYRAKIFRNWRIDCNFLLMNRKNLFGMSKFWAAILSMSLSVRKFTEIQGPFPKNCMFFSSKAIHHCKPWSFYLPNIKKYGTYQLTLKKLIWELPCFLNINLKTSLATTLLTLAMLL